MEVCLWVFWVVYGASGEERGEQEETERWRKRKKFQKVRERERERESSVKKINIKREKVCF